MASFLNMKDPKKEERKGCIVLIVLALLAFILIKSCNSCRPDRSKDSYSESPTASGHSYSFSNKESVNETDAWYATKYHVKNTLKSPSSADFPFTDYSYKELDGGVFIIKSYVDAQNSFGAELRKHFIAKIKYTGGNKEDNANWTLESLHFED